MLIEPLEDRKYFSVISSAVSAAYGVTAHSLVLPRVQPTGALLPAVTSVDPKTGSTAGGSSVKIAGTNFTNAADVDFGTVAATSVVVNSSSSITAVAPAEGAGAVDVTVTTAGGTSAASSADQFTFVAPVTLPAPVAVSPGSSTSPGPVITTLTPTFTWQAISGVSFTGYQINLYDVTTTKFVSYTTGTSVTSFTIPTNAALTAANTYEWNVRALNGTQSGPPSVYLYFQTPPQTTTALPAPVAVSPGSTTSPGPVITTLTPTFTWQAISGVTFTGYQINLHNVTTNTTVSYTTGASVTSYTVPSSAPLVAGDTYVWNVRALNGTTSGSESAYLYFQTPAATPTLPAPVADSPGTSASPGPVLTTLTPTFTWEAISGVTFTGYQINLHNVTANTTVSYTTGASVTSYALPTSAPLIAGDAYVWNVRALNGTVSGPPSVYLYFQAPSATPVTLPAPVSVSPGSSTSPGPVLTTLTPTLTWQAISGVTFTGYQINVYDVTTSASLSYTTGTGDTSFTIPTSGPLTAGNTYVWNVRAINGNQSGPPSVYLYFQTPSPTQTLPAPVAVSPGSSTSPGPVLTTSTPTFTWQAITGVTFTGYQINLHNVTADTTVSYTTGTTVTSYTVPATAPLVAGDTYVWNVRAINGTQSGPPSVYLYFQAPPATTTALPAPVAVSPGTSTSPGPVITTLTPTFTWQAISGVTFTGYQINLHNVTANYHC